MKESVHNVSTERLHVNFKAVSTDGATSSLISPFFLLSAACTGIEEHDCTLAFASVPHERKFGIFDWLGKKCKNWRLYHESSALR